MTDQILAQSSSQTLSLTILLSGEEVDTLIFALEHSRTWAWEAGLNNQHYAIRCRLLEELRAQVSPIEMTDEEILARES